MTRRLRWTETELRANDAETYVVWQLARMIVLGALRENASIIFVKKTSPTKLAIFFAVDGVLLEQMTPPVEVHMALASQMMLLCGPLQIRTGTRGEFELIRDDGGLLVAHAVCGDNEWGLTVTIRLAPPPRVLN